MTVGVLWSNGAQSAQVAPSSMTLSAGSYSGGVKSLAAANDGKFVNLYTNSRGNLVASFSFQTAGLSQVKSLTGAFKQKSSADKFSFLARNAQGQWLELGSVSGSTSSRNIQFKLPSESEINGVVTVRIVSSSGADDCSLDYLSVYDVVGSTPTPMPTPAPSATPTPAPSATPTPSPSPVAAPAAPSSEIAISAGTSWYWQLQGTVNTNVAATVYDIDLYDNSAATFSSLKQSGHKVICYFSAGTYEDWRSDAKSFPAAALGKNVDGWPGEKWLDVRNMTVRQIMMARMDLAKSKGCDGLEPDNVDGYSNGSGFPLTKDDQISFNSFLADQAHARGMTIALKNSTDLVQSLVSKFDFAVVEECFKYNECDAYTPFITQNKAVLNAEYTSFSSATCSKASALKFSTVFYNLDLNGSVYKPCQ